jgi:hypothetical protein
MVGGVGQVGSAVIEKCYSKHSGDNGIEINNAINGIVRDCEVVNAFQTGYTIKNQVLPYDRSNQTLRVENCLYRSEADFLAGSQIGYTITQATSAHKLGHVSMENCRTNIRKATNFDGGLKGIYMATSYPLGVEALRVTLKDIKFTCNDLVVPASSATSSNYLNSLLIEGTDTKLTIDGFDVKVTGSSLRATAYPLRALGILAGDGCDYDINADNLFVDMNVTGQAAASWYIPIAFVTLTGTSNPHGVVRDLRAVYYDPDTSACTGVTFSGAGSSPNVGSKLVLDGFQLQGFTGQPVNSGIARVEKRNCSWQYFESAPTTRRWEVGDVAYNSAPGAGEFVGWVCTEAGTPGTWKGYGTIQS